MGQGGAADAVVVGGGTIGAWAAWFLRRSGLERVVLVEQGTLGCGASSRAAGVVRAQGGTEAAVRLGMWTQEFYRSQAASLGVDSGFREQGYLIPAFDAAQVEAALRRVDMQRRLGLDVRWLGPDELAEVNPTLASGCALGGTWAEHDGYVDPSRNVLCYAVALARSGVDVRERTAFTGLELASGAVTAVRTTAGSIRAERVLLTGGPALAEVGARAGVAVPTGAVRHHVAVTAPHPDLSPGRLPMVFDLAEGIYWRPEEGGLLFGMSNPGETPGVAREIDWDYVARTRARLAELVPVTADLELRKIWAATIEYTPDHLPIVGPAGSARQPLDGVMVASAGGHGMMWGPALARAAADLVVTGTTDVVDVADLGLDRFDEHGRSRLAPDPVALPFPEAAVS